MLEINLLFGPKLHLMWREVDIYLTFLNSADALQLLKLSTILKHKIQFNQGPTERWDIFLVFFPNPGIVFYVVTDEGRLAKLRCVAESVTWQSQSRGHRSNPAQIVCKSKQLDPKHLREALADSRPDQDKAAALLCPVLPSSRNLLLLYKYYHISLSTIRTWLAPLRKVLYKKRSGFD